MGNCAFGAVRLAITPICYQRHRIGFCALKKPIFNTEGTEITEQNRAFESYTANQTTLQNKVSNDCLTSVRLAIFLIQIKQ